MHAKCFIIDGIVALDGSPNLSWFGFNSNYEHLYQISEPNVILRMQRSFNVQWERGTEVDADMVEKQVQIRRAQVEEQLARANAKSEERRRTHESKAIADEQAGKVHAESARMDRGSGHSQRQSPSLPRSPRGKSSRGDGSKESTGAIDENAEASTTSAPPKSGEHAHRHHHHHRHSGGSKERKTTEM